MQVIKEMICDKKFTIPIFYRTPRVNLISTREAIEVRGLYNIGTIS